MRAMEGLVLDDLLEQSVCNTEAPDYQDQVKATIAKNLREPGRIAALHVMIGLSKVDTAVIVSLNRVPALVVMGARDPPSRIQLPKLIGSPRSFMPTARLLTERATIYTPKCRSALLRSCLPSPLGRMLAAEGDFMRLRDGESRISLTLAAMALIQ